MTAWPPITRDDLRSAAKSAGFDTTFPLLVRRLISETGGSVTELDMPGGSGTAAGGFDGVVSAEQQTTFVPGGTSVWELSVGGGQTKANDDYDKRTAAPSGMSTRDVTYVQVILEPWTKARAWETDRNKESRWKRLFAYNLDRVHAWLDQAPATTAWLAERLGKAMPGVRPLTAWWDETWLPSTTIPLDASIVLAGRESAAASLRDQLSTGQRIVTLGGDLRLEEALSFVAASIQQDKSPDGATLAARTLLVSDSGSLAQLVGQSGPLVLLLSSADLAAAVPSQHPHQFLVTTPHGVTGTVDVPPVNSQAVESQFEAAGLLRERARFLGTLARRSLLALRRALAVNPVLLTPAWASAPDVVRRRLLLLGTWDGASDEDRRVVAECIGRPYVEVQEVALALAAAVETPFVGRVDERWYLLSPEDSWTLMSGHLTRDDLKAFRSAVLEVLGESDPALQMDEDERWAANIRGVRKRFSGTLRAGLARSLALLGSIDGGIRAGNTTGPEWAGQITWELLTKANGDSSYHLWSSLQDVLTLLAEAAPDVFIRAISDGLAGQKLHAKMFQDGARGQFGTPRNSPHTSFLWALELLAWSPDYLDDVVRVLAQLAAIDPGGEWSNRPDKSLSEILSCWHPSTSASLDQRLRAIEALPRYQPEISHKILLDLVPDGHGFQSEHAGPRFRDWKVETPVSHADMVRVATKAIDLLLDSLGDDASHYTSLIEKLGYVSEEHRRILAQKITSLSDRLTDDETRSVLFHALRNFVARHREYSDAEWALPESQLRILEAAAQSIQPLDLVQRNKWLFENSWVELGDRSRRENMDAYNIAVNELRTAAIGEILREDGFPAVEKLAAETQYPHLVGYALAGDTSDQDETLLTWLGDEYSSRSGVALGYFAQRLRVQDPNRLDDLLSMTDNALVKARLLRSTRDPVAAWARLAAMDDAVVRNYWREFEYYGLGGDFQHALTAARSLIAAGRYTAALELIVLYGRQSDTLEAAEVAALALERLVLDGLNDPALGRLHTHGFKQIFSLLARYRDAIGTQRIVRLEFQLLPALGFDADAPTLHASVAEDPAFFAELVAYAFRADHESDDSNQVDENALEQRRIMAGRAYEVLHTWRRCPGVDADGTLDGPALQGWVAAARAHLETKDRLATGETQIGHALAFAPADPDGTYPPVAVRELLESIQSDRLDNGLESSIYNKRGFTTRGMMDGGTQEWKLAEAYRNEAGQSTSWPRTRKLFVRLAESYERDARREDEEAEWRRRGLHE